LEKSAEWPILEARKIPGGCRISFRRQAKSSENATVPDSRMKAKELPMDFIERIFHLSPDNGDGSLEAAILAVLALSLSLVALKVMHRRGRFSWRFRR
jgi:hypothetical protein